MPVDAAAVAALAGDPSVAALRRSLAVAYGDPARNQAWDAFYSRFVGPGDLAFDVGAHVGDRTASFRRCDARVVAVEPQPLCLRVLRRLYAGDDSVTVVAAACAARPDPATMRVNTANPTVSTLSTRFVAAADGAGGWEHEVWDARERVSCTTLDALVAAYGVPAFVKIDVEGFEDEVLAGLGHPLPALSFEFTTIRREVALRCLDRLTRLGRLTPLGRYGFDVVRDEVPEFVFGRWVSADEMAAYLRALPHEANAADVYCRTVSPPSRDAGGDG